MEGVHWAQNVHGDLTGLKTQGGPRTHSSDGLGVQQGDQLGPLLFALALQPALSAAGRGQLDLCFAYLDDVCRTGDCAAVSAAVGRLANAVPHKVSQTPLQKRQGASSECSWSRSWRQTMMQQRTVHVKPERGTGQGLQPRASPWFL